MVSAMKSQLWFSDDTWPFQVISTKPRGLSRAHALPRRPRRSRSPPPAAAHRIPEDGHIIDYGDVPWDKVSWGLASPHRGDPN
jgi:hypothetical protein